MSYQIHVKFKNDFSYQIKDVPYDKFNISIVTGDNDPIDVLEIGYRVAERGEIVQVKILGTLALIDEGETDWKILAIDVKDPLADQVNDIADIEKHFPGLLRATVEWFKVCFTKICLEIVKIVINIEVHASEMGGNLSEETLRVVRGLHPAWK